MSYRAFDIRIPDSDDVDQECYQRWEDAKSLRKASICCCLVVLITIIAVVLDFFDFSDTRVEWAKQFDIN